MADSPRYQYRVFWINDDCDAVDLSMKQWADKGWELVSGGASSWASSDGGGYTQWHTKYVMYWRKPFAD